MTTQRNSKRKVTDGEAISHATEKGVTNNKGIKFLKRVGYSDIHTLVEDESAFFYEAGMMIDADGAFHAYHPNGKSGLDFLGNAGNPGNWWALVTDSGHPSGHPIVQTVNDPAPGFYISTTSLEDTNCDRRDPRRYVNSEAINFVVLPGRLSLGVKLGDLAVAIRPQTGASAFAIYGDVGPAKKIGEASIALANALGISSSPKTGGVGHGVVYIIFPGTKQGWPLAQNEIDQKAGDVFAKWGGMDRAKYCFPNHDWAQVASHRLSVVRAAA